MLLSMVNNTGSTISLLSGSVSVPGNSTTAVTNTTFQYQLATDGFTRQNILAGNLSVSDGTNNLASTDGINYLYLIFQALGPLADGSGNQLTSTTINSKQRLDANLSSEGTDNATAPFGTQQIGGVDPTGKLQTFNVLPTGEQFVRDVINTSFTAGTISVGTTPIQVKVGASVLANRKYARVQPINGIVYQGSANTVTSSTGGPLFLGQVEVKAFTDNVTNWWLVSATGTITVYVEEGS